MLTIVAMDGQPQQSCFRIFSTCAKAQGTDIGRSICAIHTGAVAQALPSLAHNSCVQTDFQQPATSSAVTIEKRC